MPFLSYRHDEFKVCKKYTYDEGCSISTTGSSPSCATNSGITSYAYCAFDSQNEYYCKKNNYTCGYSYFNKENNCGGFKGINEAEKIQCAQLRDSNQCFQISIDADCAIDDNGDCEKRESSNLDRNEYKCKLIIDRSGVSDIVQCKKIEVSAGCKVDNGYCQPDTDDTTNYHHYQKCEFNDDNTKCELKNKACNEISGDCSDCKTVSTGKECKKVNDNYYCQEITINQKCEVKNNGECSIKTAETNKKCSFDYNPITVTKCELYEVEPGCTINQSSGQWEDDTNNLINNKKCVFKDLAKTQCKLEDVTSCEDYKNPDKCEDDTKLKKDTEKCSWNVDSCKKYTIQSPCTVRYASCSGEPTDNKVCLFNKEENECIPREKKCESYYNQNGKCYSEFPITDTSTKQCIQYSEDNYCKEIEIHQDCKVNQKNECDFRNTNFQQKDGICVFDDEVQKNKCTKRERKCTEYTDNTCESLTCSYYPNKYKCYETDEYCTCNIDNYGNFLKRRDKTLTDTEKCDRVKIDENGGFICKKVDKECFDYADSTKCSNVARTKEKQCYKFSDWSTCKDIKLDGFCYVDENGKCVKDPSASLSNNEICDFDYDKTECLKREKLCSDISKDECTSYTPVNKKCYKITSDGSTKCQEIKVDSQCSIDENSECKGKGCSFEDNDTKEHCAYKSNGSLLTFKRVFTLLTLLILFWN